MYWSSKVSCCEGIMTDAQILPQVVWLWGLVATRQQPPFPKYLTCWNLVNVRYSDSPKLCCFMFHRINDSLAERPRVSSLLSRCVAQRLIVHKLGLPAFVWMLFVAIQFQRIQCVIVNPNLGQFITCATMGAIMERKAFVSKFITNTLHWWGSAEMAIAWVLNGSCYLVRACHRRNTLKSFVQLICDLHLGFVQMWQTWQLIRKLGRAKRLWNFDTHSFEMWNGLFSCTRSCSTWRRYPHKRNVRGLTHDEIA